MNQPDRALAQFERSLAIDPKHTKTLLNIGIVRAFGKQDLEGRRESVAAGDRDRARVAGSGAWRGRRSQGLRSAHPQGGRRAPAPGQPGK